MRSEYVFAAVKEITNRFLLCRVASVSARRLHRDSAQSSQTINKSLHLIATAEPGEPFGVAIVKSSPPPVNVVIDATNLLTT
jgi:hypothetical protein